jgi:2-polyprenyl-6-methoxyphenol hydroxylase-like FAD-dependent oxidoreductase
MRIAIVGAGLAGLATAAAFSGKGHEVTVFEQADGLRASGLAINLWSNATSLLPSFGVPADRIPGHPFSRMVIRTGGREVAAMKLPPKGLPHVNVQRAELLSALAGTLPPGSVKFGARCTDARELAGDHDLVVLADGARSALRTAVAEPPRKRWNWTVWQACVTADVSQIPADAGASIVRPGLFSGVWRLSDGRVTWFVEQQDRARGNGRQLLADLEDDEDPVLRELVAATPPEEWIEWRTEDMWPRRPWHSGNIVLVGDAAHAMLPTLGQGACQSLEDAAVLAAAVTAGGPLDQALRRYEAKRVPRTRRIVALARMGARGRQPNPAARAMPAALNGRLMAISGGVLLRRLTRPTITVPG